MTIYRKNVLLLLTLILAAENNTVLPLVII